MKIAPDKWKHFFVGIALGAMLQLFFGFVLSIHMVLCVSLALVFSFAVAYGFELYSRFTGKGHYEVMDAVAAEIGAAIGIITVVLIQLA